MSAIAGLLMLDGRPAAREALEAMSAALAAHGPDGAGIWTGGAAGLAQRLMIITPEDARERQPLAGRSGTPVVVFDGRLDNRPELAEALGIPPAGAGRLPDSAFVLRAFETWGEAAPGRLEGDFTLAAWDAAHRRLLLACSPLGEQPLFYHAAPGRFAFASAPGALFTLPGVPRRIDEERLIVPFLSGTADPGRTIFREIRRVLPGRMLCVDAGGGMREAVFWELDLERRVEYPRDDDYVDAFLEVFDRAVGRRLRSLHPVGSMMSGGLDSSSVAATAARLLAPRNEPLHVYTEVPRPDFDGAVPPGRYADETPYVRAIARLHPNMRLNLVRSDGYGPFDRLDRFFDALESPFRGVSNRVWLDAIHEQAREQGVRVLLAGYRGNLTISWRGSGLLPELLRRGAWAEAWRELRAGRPGPATGAGKTLLRTGLLPLLPASVQRLLPRLRGRPVPGDSLEGLAFLHPELYAALREQVKRPDGQVDVNGASRAGRYQMLFPYGIGHYRSGFQALCGVQERDPTSDVRVVEFCFGVPEGQHLRDGIARRLVRRAMADRLPAEVLHNPRRGLQAAYWFERLTASREQIRQDLDRFQESETARRLLNVQLLRQLLDAWPQQGAGSREVLRQYGQLLQQGCMLGRFALWFEAGSGPPDRGVRP